ncbi:MAG: hypothetical protein A2W23_01405 [Planctomycetes bacterium RBG_16_43_13]|nr:MAG: hypothetical protein A2W23_01405 [Planctomycetes bacterium RBG_16_43_13]
MPYYSTVRYGKMLSINKFKFDSPQLKQTEKCIVKTDRGSELGTLLTVPQPLQDTLPPDSIGDVLRRATPDDLNSANKIEKEDRVKEMTFCKEQILKLQLQMKLIDIDHLIGGEKIIFYFTSETRVDFRELVKVLAQEFKTRIELKQIGARDEARLVGDCGHCGLKLCCAGFLKELGGITMDMAKIQKHTADPSKITGRCGKLLCCLRYEYNDYKEWQDKLPPVGTNVTTIKGNGVVVGQDLYSELVVIERETGDRVPVKIGEISAGFERKGGCNGCPTGASAE